MTDEIVFDNFLVTDDKVVAEKWTEQTFQIKSAAEKASSGGVSSSHTLRECQTSVRLIIKIQLHTPCTCTLRSDTVESVNFMRAMFHRC